MVEGDRLGSLNRKKGGLVGLCGKKEKILIATRRAEWELGSEEFHFVEEGPLAVLLRRPRGLGAAHRQPG